MPNPRSIPKNLLILHYHLRPGGVRRVIEMYLPALAASGAFDTITLAVGEAADRAWEEPLKASLAGVNFRIHVEPALGYLTERAADAPRMRQALRGFLTRFSNPETLVWAHNLGLGRNILLADELARHSAASGVPVLSQQHDFWFDNRWARWPVLQANGFGSLSKVAKAVFAAGGRVVHAAINTADESLLAKHIPGRTVWLPNPSGRGRPPSDHDVRGAARWLRKDLGHDGPVWIFPTRFLRRKNIAEAVLLTRWLRPEAMLVTTAGVSSPEEADYARRLEDAARHGGWPVRFRLLAGRDAQAPSVPALMSAAETILLTSVQEGFGLPFLEAAALRRPLLARRLANVEPDLLRLGFKFPGVYDEVFVPVGMFDHAAERLRQELVYEGWKKMLPRPVRHLAGRPRLLELAGSSACVAFSALTLTAQLEILAQDPAGAWAAASPHNPGLRAAAAAAGQPVEWPENAESQISPTACAARLLEAALGMTDARISDREAVRTQKAFISDRLQPQFLHPLLMQS